MPPRSAARQRNATPARTTRATSNAVQDTPSTRRSTRGGTRQADDTKNVVSNPALPEIQTQQSYAYGASKAPVLPEQLQAGNMPMDAVAERMRSAIEMAEKSFEAHAAEVRGYTPESQVVTRGARSRKKASAEPSPQPHQTPEEVRKTQRTAAWVESSQLDDITEESSAHESPDRRREGSEPSSFPSGMFEHSYNYERGLRGPRVTQHVAWRDELFRIRSESLQRLDRWTTQFSTWLSRLAYAVRNSFAELPESRIFLSSVKVVVLSMIIMLCGVIFCSIWSYSCAPDSPSWISQSISKLCGRCTNDASGLMGLQLNVSNADISTFNDALNTRYHQLQQQIQHAEARLRGQLDKKQALHAQDIESLRQQQIAIELQLQRLSGRGSPDTGTYAGAVASPLIPKINYFSLANGALADPYSSSPTRQKPFLLPLRVALNLVGLHKYRSNPHTTALAAWHDEGDCWCAAESSQGQLRLAVGVRELMYPTELVVEHFPAGGSLAPDTAPRDIELWADFSHLSSVDFTQRLRIPDLQAQAAADARDRNIPYESPFLSGSASDNGDAWARIGTATYQLARPDDDISSSSSGTTSGRATSHVQRFSLDVNQNGNLHHAERFMLRVTQNHGADYTCLYRVRLHGVPVKERNKNKDKRPADVRGDGYDDDD